MQTFYTTDCKSDGWDPQEDRGDWERDSPKSSAADKRAQPAIHQRHGEKPGQIPQRTEEQGGGVQKADPGVWGKVRSGARTRGEGGGHKTSLLIFMMFVQNKSLVVWNTNFMKSSEARFCG